MGQADEQGVKALKVLLFGAVAVILRQSRGHKHSPGPKASTVSSGVSGLFDHPMTTAIYGASTQARHCHLATSPLILTTALPNQCYHSSPLYR